MKISPTFPPNYGRIAEVLPAVRTMRGVLFCYGDTIYAPGVFQVPPELLAHEKVHSVRQLDEGVEEWWDRYLLSPIFRLQEEILAHKAEYNYVALHGNRQLRRHAAAHIGAKLASPIYGKLITKQAATRLMKYEHKTEPVHAQALADQAPA